MTPIATIRRQCPHTGNWITGPAHLFAPPRVKASVPMQEWMKRHEGVGG